MKSIPDQKKEKEKKKLISGCSTERRNGERSPVPILIETCMHYSIPLQLITGYSSRRRKGERNLFGWILCSPIRTIGRGNATFSFIEI